MASLFHCPYCNSSFSVSEEEATSARVRCPDCGDTFPNHLTSEDGLAATRVAGKYSTPPGNLTKEQTTPTGMSNSKTLRNVLLFMGSVAFLGLILALATTWYRRANDRKPVSDRATSPHLLMAPVAPWELPALGYLPEDCFLVAGFHFGEMAIYPEGKKLRQDLRANKEPLGLAAVEERLGIDWENIDQVCLGLRDYKGIPQLSAVIHTIQPYREKKIAEALAPAKPSKFRNRPVYPLRGMKFVQGYVFLPDDYTIIVQASLLGSKIEDLQSIPRNPRDDLSGFPTTVKNLMTKKLLNPEIFLWAAGDLTKVKKIIPLLKQMKPFAKLANQGFLQKDPRAFTIGFNFHPKGLTLNATFQADLAAEDLAQMQNRTFPEWVTQKPVIVAGKDSWTLMQIRMNVSRALAEMKESEE